MLILHPDSTQYSQQETSKERTNVGKVFRNPAIYLVAFLLLISIMVQSPVQSHDLQMSDKSSAVQAPAMFNNLPLRFEENVGQSDPAVRFLNHGTNQAMFFTANEAVIVLAKPRSPNELVGGSPKQESDQVVSDTNVVRPTAVLRLQLQGANPNPQLIGEDVLPTKSNYLIGSQSSRWHTNITNYTKIHYVNVYSGVDLAYYGNGSNLEYDFTLAPGIRPETIHLRIDGTDKLEVQGGVLVIHKAIGELRQPAPHIYQDGPYGKVDVPGSYVLTGNDEVSFAASAYNPTLKMVIDPVLAYSSDMGGSSADAGYGIAVDRHGNAYTTGSTMSPDFPHANNTYYGNGLW